MILFGGFNEFEPYHISGNSMDETVVCFRVQKNMVRMSILPGEMTRKLKILLGWFGWWWSEDEEEEAHGAELFEWTVVGLKVQDLPGKCED